MLLCFFIFGANAQGIQFETGNWKDAIQKAKKEKRLIYVDVYTDWCGPCKMMAKNIFPTKEAGDKYNATFVNMKIDAEKGEGIEIAKKYAVTAYPTNFYINPETEKVVYKAVGGTDLNGFLQRADYAVAEYKDPMTMAFYQKHFKAGERDSSFLRKYIEKATRSDNYADEALDDYLKLYGKKVNDNLLNFLLENTKTFDNNAIAILAKNKDRINELHNGVNEDYFTEWQQQLPYHTFQKAIINKDEKLIDLLYQNMNKYGFDSNILGKGAFEIMYYSQLKDTANAIAKTNELMNYLTELPKDKYETQNDIELGLIKKSITQQVKKAGMPDSQVVTIIKSTLEAHPEYAYSANFLASQKLNEAAWNIYEEKQENSNRLKDALKWSNKAMTLSSELPQYSMFADTYAHLLYKTGAKEDAIKVQEDAVKVGQEHGVEGLKDLQKALDEMKSGTLK